MSQFTQNNQLYRELITEFAQRKYYVEVNDMPTKQFGSSYFIDYFIEFGQNSSKFFKFEKSKYTSPENFV